MTNISRRSGVIHATSDGEVVVRIEQFSACSGCHARGACTSADQADRFITVHTQDSTAYSVGDRVVIEGKDRVGRLAVLLAFVLPIILLMGVCAIGINWIGLGESLSILLALTAIGSYFLVLHRLDPLLGRVIRFSVSKSSAAPDSALGSPCTGTHS